jgi:hypothetical protein
VARPPLNQCCLLALDFESMFRAGMVKILLQQYRHKADTPTCLPVVCFWGKADNACLDMRGVIMTASNVIRRPHRARKINVL